MTAYVPGLSETDLKKVILSLQQLASGRSNAVGVVTLRPNETTTTVATDNCAAGSVPILEPKTANAASARAAMYTSAVANRSFTITHTSSAQTDRTFLYAIVG